MASKRKPASGNLRVCVVGAGRMGANHIERLAHRADVEIFGNAQFGYQVATQAVFEKGVVNIGEDGGPHVRSAGRWGGEVTRSYIDRFKNAYFCSLMISTMASSSYD